jgi:hypothetical protein
MLIQKSIQSENIDELAPTSEVRFSHMLYLPKFSDQMSMLVHQSRKVPGNTGWAPWGRHSGRAQAGGCTEIHWALQGSKRGTAGGRSLQACTGVSL